MDQLPRNRCFWFLCQTLQTVRDFLPEKMVFSACGKTDLCNERWDLNVEKWKIPKKAIGEEIADPRDNTETLMVWFDELLQDNHLHKVWNHLLDGQCLWDQLTDDVKIYKWNVLWCLTTAVAAWLRHICRHVRQKKVRVICVCNAGKHRSVYFGRMLHQVFLILFDLLKLRSKHTLQFQWAAKTRVDRERETDDSKSWRQGPLVVSRLKAVFFMGNESLPHIVNLNITDQLMKLVSSNYFTRLADYSANIRAFLENSRVNGAAPVRNWISDMLEEESLGTLALQGCDLRSQWFPCMHHLMCIFPQDCSLCLPQWTLAEPLKTVVERLENREGPKGRLYLTPDQIANLGARHGSVVAEQVSASLLTAAALPQGQGAGDVSLLTTPASPNANPGVSVLASGGEQGATPAASEASGVPVLASGGGARQEASPAASAASGVSVLTSGAVAPGVSVLTSGDTAAATASAMPKRPAWADATDTGSRRSEKRQKQVRFQGIANPDAGKEEDKNATASVRDMPSNTYDAFIMHCNLQRQVLLDYGTQEMTTQNDQTCLRQVAQPRFRWRLQEHEDIRGLVDWAEARVHLYEDLVSEMTLLDESIRTTETLPNETGLFMCGLHRIQFYIFLHLWSILKQDYAFFVSSRFLQLATEPLREEKNYDVLAAMHRYCYLIWLHRMDDPKTWLNATLSFQLPNAAEWQQWWEQEQLAAQNIDEMSFSEEYLIMLQDPLRDDDDGNKIRDELKKIGDNMTIKEMPKLIEIPARATLHEHDVYHNAADVLPCPRALPVFRCSAARVSVMWGNADGEPKQITRENIVAETHCCLEVDVPVPQNMTLDHVLGTRDWKKSFEEIRMPRPFWLPAIAPGSSAGAASGFSADATPSAIATQIHLQALGAEIMATLRPDNVMHPHLRAHVEFMLGVFASVHLYRQDAYDILLSDFLAGCGIRTTVTGPREESWVGTNYIKRHEKMDSVVRPMCHTLWGERYRPIGYPGDSKKVYLVHDVCPYADCELHKEVVGYGTLCCHWHGFNKKHGNMCTISAQRWLRYQNIGDKGRSTRTERGISQYFKTFLENLEFVAPRGTISDDADDRILLIGLPRWLPQFKSNTEVQPGVDLVPYHGRMDQRHFVQQDVNDCRILRTHQTNLFDALVKLMKKK